MKNILKFISVSLFAALFLTACEKDENQVILQGGTNPVLSAEFSNDTMVLERVNQFDNAIKFTWTNPRFVFNTGVSSQNVTYTIQVDTTGANFSSIKKGEKSIANDTTLTFTVKDLNTLLLGMNLVENQAHTVDIRVRAAMENTSAPLYSNVYTFTITPYLDVVYPVPANLYITGAATPGGWMGGGDPELLTQKFTQVSGSDFEIASLAINPNEGFLFIPVYGNWDNKYGFTGAAQTNNVNGDTFKPNGNDFKSPAAAGNYKIQVSFKTGTYKMIKL